MTQGVVLTRDEQAHAPGDLVLSEACLLLPNDTQQIHDDLTPEHVLDVPGLRQIEVAHFEGTKRFYVGIIGFTNAGNIETFKLSYRSVNASGPIKYFGFWGGDGVLSDVSTRVAFVHRGNEYFICGGRSRAFTMYPDADDPDKLKLRWMCALAFAETHLQVAEVPEFLSDKLPWVSRFVDTVGEGWQRLNGTWSRNYNAFDYFSPFYAEPRIVTSPSNVDDTSQLQTGDYAVYWITEYDSVNDVESPPYHFLAFSPGLGRTPFNTVISSQSIEYVDIVADFSYTPQNESATKLRLYRHIGRARANLNEVSAELNDYATKKNFWRGQLVDELDITGTPNAPLGWQFRDDFKGSGDEGIGAYPLVDAIDGSISDGYAPTPQFYVGAEFDDSLVGATRDDPQALFYTSQGRWEYSPEHYRIVKTTAGDDTTVAVAPFRKSLLWFRRESIFRLDYLLFGLESTQFLGRQLEQIDTGSGAITASMVSPVSTTTGELMVWLDWQGLKMTDGQSVVDACGDFALDRSRINRDAISSAFFVNDRERFRLRLYAPLDEATDPTHIYDFYYHRTHFKEGGFKLLGPTPITSGFRSGTSAIIEGKHRAFVGTGSAIHEEYRLRGALKMRMRFGWLNPPTPDGRIEVLKVGLGLGPNRTVDGVMCKIEYQAEALGALGSEEHPLESEFKKGRFFHAFDSAAGQHVQMELSLGAPVAAAQTWGPLLALVEESDDGGS